jgi:hypothetical protein
MASLLSGTLLRTDRTSEGSVFLLETALRQGWPVGLGRWDITKHWIWTDGLVSAARVDDADDGDYNCRCHRGQMRCVAREGGVEARRGTHRSGRKQQQAVWECGAATEDACRSQRPTRRVSGRRPGAVECCPAALVRIRHERQHAGTTHDARLGGSGTRVWLACMIGRGRGRAVTFVRTGVACCACSVGGCSSS